MFSDVETNATSDGVENELTEYEVMKGVRDSEFDKRINAMKEEISNINTAEILHPGIYNIPNHLAMDLKVSTEVENEYSE